MTQLECSQLPERPGLIDLAPDLGYTGIAATMRVKQPMQPARGDFQRTALDAERARRDLGKTEVYKGVFMPTLGEMARLRAYDDNRAAVEMLKQDAPRLGPLGTFLAYADMQAVVGNNAFNSYLYGHPDTYRKTAANIRRNVNYIEWEGDGPPKGAFDGTLITFMRKKVDRNLYLAVSDAARVAVSAFRLAQDANPDGLIEDWAEVLHNSGKAAIAVAMMNNLPQQVFMRFGSGEDVLPHSPRRHFADIVAGKGLLGAQALTVDSSKYAKINVLSWKKYLRTLPEGHEDQIANDPPVKGLGCPAAHIKVPGSDMSLLLEMYKEVCDLYVLALAGVRKPACLK